MRIENIRRWPDKPYVYAELRDDDGRLIISATLDYILAELASDRFKDRLQEWAYARGVFCRSCQQRVPRKRTNCLYCDFGNAPVAWTKGTFHHVDGARVRLKPCGNVR